MNDLFVVVAIALAAAFGAAAATSTRTDFIRLAHQADPQINGKTIESTQSFVNIAKHFQLLSEMSIDDLATIGNTLGFGDILWMMLLVRDGDVLWMMLLVRDGDVLWMMLLVRDGVEQGQPKV